MKTLQKIAICVTSLLVALSSFAQNKAYKAGEELKYLVYYGIVDGGTATLSVKEINDEGKNVYYGEAYIETTGIAKVFCPLADRYKTWYDKNSGLPYKAVRDVHEGDYYDYELTTFDRARDVVVSSKKGEKKAPKNIADIVSAFYNARSYQFGKCHIGDTIEFITYFGGDVYPMYIVYKGNTTIKTKAGKFNVMKFMPICEVGRIFDDEDDMTLYVTNDANKIPIRIELDMLIGSLKCDLISYKNIANPIAFSK